MKKLPKKMHDALNAQVGRELENAHAYLNMGNWLDLKGWTGMASWMRVQASEERKHAQKFQEYICDRLEAATVPAIEATPGEYASVVEVFEKALEREHQTTDHIYDLAELADDTKDLQTRSLMDWFLDEQVEEVKSVYDILQQLQNRGGEAASFLAQLNERLGERK